MFIMSSNKWILVTGASSGIGRKSAELLAQNGFNVYAGARKQSDLDELEKIPNITAVKLDVTSDEDVNDFQNKLEKTGLFGIVNNAGIALGAPLMDLEIETLEKQFEVNFFGIHRITKAVFPYILKEKGRIIMISSNAGSFASPFFGPYSSSKYALEGYSDSLRREIMLHDVKVVLVKPGRIRTPIWEKGEDLLLLYEGSIFTKEAKAIGKSAIKSGKEDSLKPIEVAKIVLKACVAKNPKPRYVIAPNPFGIWIREHLPDRMIDNVVKNKLMEARDS
ncbi:MAG: SDR family NAD(P)-dependent oxidoreductase [Promethearchaeota archaeon]|nr:MAG: SDR family NAD(P)-dependent oxidoreductase [Candidatus Lokiarchaeota archaeon]